MEIIPNVGNCLGCLDSNEGQQDLKIKFGFIYKWIYIACDYMHMHKFKSYKGSGKGDKVTEKWRWEKQGFSPG